MNTKPFDLVIFDCDGVLVDSEPLANQVFVQMLREFGHQADEKTYLKKFSGVTLPNRISVVARELHWNPPADFLDIFNERLSAISERELKPVPGIHELIEGLSVPICVASNGSREEVVLRLRLSNLTERFGGAIFSGLEVSNPKPAPDVYLAAAAAFHLPPERCIVIEDSLPGVTAAVRAGMKVYGHAAFTPAESLRKAGAIPFGSMRELQALLSNGHKSIHNSHDKTALLVNNLKVDTAR